MSSLVDWLALRERFDVAARSTSLTRAVAEALPSRRPLRIVDLATGIGSNIRYLSRQLPRPQEWLAIDRDPLLLSQVPAPVETRCMDLGSLDDALFADRALVTASALLDLVSERWIADLAARCRAAHAVVLLALTYDGRSHCTPHDPMDDDVRELFNEHQHRNDKGFGPAAGGDAVQHAIRSFRRAGYDVRHERTDWQLPSGAREMQTAVLEGWAQAAAEIAPSLSGAIAQWLDRRLAHVEAGRSTIVVGHEDIAASP